MPVKVEAVLLGFRPGGHTHLRKHLMTLGASIFVASRIATSALASSICQQIDAGQATPVMWCSYIIQDETPMKLSQRTNTSSLYSATSKLATVSDVRQAKANLEKIAMKIVQSEVMHMVVLQDPTSKTFTMIYMELPTCLQACRTATGASLHQCMREQLDCALVMALRKRFPINIDCSTGDRGSANGAMDGIFRQSDLSIPRLAGRGCCTHKMHTVQGKCFSIRNGAIAGSIAMALAEQPAGSVGLLRQAIAEVLLANARVFLDTSPPSASSDEVLYRGCVFDLVLSQSERDQRRRVILESNLRGDIRKQEIDVYTAGISEDQALVFLQEWSQETSMALLPAPHKIFSRNRWLTGVDTIGEPALLAATHNVLVQAVPRWLSLLGKKTDPVAMAADRGWLVEDERARVGEDDVDLGARSHWTIMNDQARGDAARFARAQPLVDLLLLRITLGPQVKMLDRFLHQGSAEWDRQQELEAIRSGVRKFRILEAHRGRNTEKLFDEIGSLMFSQDGRQKRDIDLRSNVGIKPSSAPPLHFEHHF